MKKHLLLSLPLIVALASCNTQTTPKPPVETDLLKPYKEQKLNWQTCDPTIIEYPPLLDAVVQRTQCANVTVPMDYKNPSRGDIKVAVLRVAARTTENRKGAIFINPGGPGGDGLIMAPVFASWATNANPQTEFGKNILKIVDQYDLIGFSPRGTGASSRLYCGTNEDLPFYHLSEDRSAQNVQQMLKFARIQAEACQKNPLTPFINTENTARDMDLIRGLLKDDKLNYFGYSYGTWLGSWYAKLFPKNTGKMVLDANMATHSTFEAQKQLTAVGFNRTFFDVVLPFAARHNAVFGLGATRDEVASKYNNLSPALKATLQYYPGSIVGDLYSSQSWPEVPVKLIAALGLEEILQTAQSDFEIFDAIGKYTFSKNPALQGAAQMYAFQMVGTLLDYLNEATLGDTTLSPGSAVFTAVTCNDTPTTKGEKHWVDLGNTFSKSAPLIGGDLTVEPCQYWGEPTTTKPATPAAKDFPAILMVQAEMDNATPIEGAFPAQKALPNSKMVFVDNEASHAVFPYGSDCVDLAVTRYLLDGTLPKENFTACQAFPILGENQVYEVGQKYASGEVPTIGKQAVLSKQQSLERNFMNPALASELLEKYRSLTIQNGFFLRGPLNLKQE